jgi:hypothetical protein
MDLAKAYVTHESAFTWAVAAGISCFISTLDAEYV